MIFKANNKESGKTFFTPAAGLAFVELRQTFSIHLILRYFDPKYHIWIEIDVLGYAIGRIMSQLTPDGLRQLNLVACFSEEIMPAETEYEMTINSF